MRGNEPHIGTHKIKSARPTPIRQKMLNIAPRKTFLLYGKRGH